jgi:hypothetical protein
MSFLGGSERTESVVAANPEGVATAGSDYTRRYVRLFIILGRDRRNPVRGWDPSRSGVPR